MLGAGSWGTTFAWLTSATNRTVLWARRGEVAAEIHSEHTNSAYLGPVRLPARLRATADIAEAVHAAEIVVVAVPARAFRATLEAAQPYVPAGVPVVSLTKGIEAGTLLRMTEVISEVLPGRPPAALSGPNLSGEIAAGRAAASVVATEDAGVAISLQKVLQHRRFRVYRNHDVIGCEVGGAFKNVIAIATGIGEGLGVGDNAKAAVMTRGLAELTRLAVAMGGEAQTLAGLAGMGDLVATCTSPLSRNRTVGEHLGRGEPLERILAGMHHMVAEGVETARAALAIAERYGVDLPICEEIHQIVTGSRRPDQAYRGLRLPGHEAEPW